MGDKRQFCTFFLEEFFCGIPVEQVQEVIRFQHMTAVPLAPPIFAGLINLRGEIITAIDLRQRLQMPGHKRPKEPLNIVIRTAQGPFSLLVDRVAEVIEVAEEDFEATPDTVRGPGKDVISGAYKLDQKLLLVFDTEKLLENN
jgi:purine-binding chemotaxis protein CheW